MIRSVRLENLKTHVDTTVEVDRLTVLVGPNGAGKSSILTALELVHRLDRGRVDDLRAAPTALLFSARSGHHEAVVSAELDRGRVRLGLTALDDHERLLIRATLPAADGGEPEIREVPLSAVERAPRRTRAPELAVLLRFDADRLAEPAPPMARPRIAADGFGLSAVIAEMILGGSPRFESIVRDVRRVVPQVSGLRVRTVAVEAADGRIEGRLQLLVDFDHARGIPAHSVSHGTLIAIGLLTALHGEHRPQVLLLDDLDTGLHPRAQWEVVAALRRVLDVVPGLQIVATTHSAYLLDAVEPHEVRVLALDADGRTRCRRLSAHPRASDLLAVLSTGELLAAEGEGWVLEGGRHD